MSAAIRFGWLFWLFPQVFFAQSPFYVEDFSAPGFPTGWTTEDVSGNAAQYLIPWEKCESGSICPPNIYGYFNTAFSGQTFGSASAENGYLFANSDATSLPYGTVPHISQLTSPTIDCSQQDQVVLRFESHISVNDLNPHENAVLRVTTNGVDWTTFTIFPELNLPGNETRFNQNAGTFWVDISSIAAQQPNVQLQWQWTGDEEWGWIIDDIYLFPVHPVYNKAVWGTGPQEGRFETGLEGWTLNPLFGSDEEWIWAENGYFGNALSAGTGFYLSSASPFDGAASFNADYYTTGGEPPGPGPLPIYFCELISPSIDLSEEDALLKLRFIQSVRILNRTNQFPFITSWAFSLDDGNTWSDWVNANSGLPINGSWSSTLSSFLLPAELAGEENVRLKFLFAGDLYGWFIDDITIALREPNDLAIQDNFFAISPSLQTPLSAVSPLYFLIDVRNEGQNDLTNAAAQVEIRHDEMGVVFQDTVVFGTIAADELVENIQFSNAFLPGMTGKYSGKYFVYSDSADTAPANDTAYWDFVITDSIFAKELGPTGGFTPDESNSFSYGNCFYIPPSTALKACKVTFGIANFDQLFGQKVSVITYEIPDGDFNGDLEIDPTEYQQVAFNEHTIDGSQGDIITIPLQLNGEAISLNPDSYYAILVRYFSFDQNDRCFILASQEYDLQATYFLYNLIEDPRYFSLLDINDTGTFDVIGLGDSGFDRLPLVRLHLCATVPGTVEVATQNLLRVYPNPTDTQVLIESNGIEIAQVLVTDVQGRVIMQKNYNSSPILQLSVNMENWSTGMYNLLVLDTEGHYHYQKIVRLGTK